MSIRKFDTLTPRGKAVRIAKDVLLQLKVKKLIATEGKYFTAYYDWTKIKEGVDLEDLKTLTNISNSCQACAIGAAICSYANLNGPIRYSQAQHGTSIRTIFSSNNIFSLETLGLIEAAFERAPNFHNIAVNVVSETYSPAAHRAVKFGKKYKNPESRLKAIMNNIIQNRGVFKP